ncbi:MAG: response regulator transcription factor [Mycobacteriales bacterium]
MDVDAARVLVIEDEPVLRDAVVAALREAGLVGHGVTDGRGFGDTLAAFRPDAVVLDIMLPGRSGIELAGLLRSTSQAAIIFLTAREAVDDRLAGFAVGADDYVLKPFVVAELIARIRAVLRRTGRMRSSSVQVADLVVDEDAGEVNRAGTPVPVTATELRLLTYLARNRGRVLSKTQILTQVWGYDAYDPNLVEAHVSSLRRKLESAGPRLIHTVRGIGYRIGDSASASSGAASR